MRYAKFTALLLIPTICLFPIRATATDNIPAAGVTQTIIEYLNQPSSAEEEPEVVEEAPELIEIEATAYWNKYSKHCADGCWPYVGVLAGKRSWLGKTVILYDSNMNCMGTYTFRDTGYGQSTGWGESYLKRGSSVGTIEAGLCIDIYMETESECRNFGRSTVFMEWKE